jgi:hypothetical protein
MAMTASRRNATGIGVGIIALGVFAAFSAEPATQPTPEQVQMCNTRAAEAVARTSKGTTGPMATTSRVPGQPAPGNVQPGTSGNPTGGRATDSTEPGAPPSAVSGTVSQEVLRGMAPAGQNNQAYQQSYLVCMRQLGFE